MKKILLILVFLSLLCFFVGCAKDGEDGKTPYIQDGYWYIDGVNTGIKAESTDGVNGLNGQNGTDGKDGVNGVDGKTPYIQDGYWYIDGENTNIKAEGVDGTDGRDGADGKDGKDGIDGQNGADGNGIVSIELTSRDGNVDTYTITFSNGSHTTFTVTNAPTPEDSVTPGSFELIEKGDGYVLPSSGVGKQVSFGSFSKHSKYVIPPHVNVKITLKTGGSYGFARTDKNGLVIESCSNANYSEYTFAAKDEVTYLFTSDDKVISIHNWSSEQAADSFWAGKRIWWCGTSIPAGGYPILVGEELGAVIFQEAVGGSMCRANVSTGDYNGANISNITSSLSMTLEEANAFIDNYDILRTLSKNSSWPTVLEESQKKRIVAGSFEKKLLPYLDGTKPMPDLFVIDHGHNDWKYRDINGNIDIELEPTVENIRNGLLAEDTYMTANNYENLKKYFGDLEDFPRDKLEEFAASVNRNCFKGSINFIVTLILCHNPQARIVFISNYEYENGYNKAYSNVIDAQISLANDWCFPIFEIYKYLGYSDKIIPGSKDYMSEQYPDYSFNKDVTAFEIYNVDKVHPSSDTTGRANEIYAGLIASFLKNIR